MIRKERTGAIVLIGVLLLGVIGLGIVNTTIASDAVDFNKLITPFLTLVLI